MGLVLVLLVGALALNALRLDLFAAPRLAARYDVGAYRLALAPGEPAAGWIEAVREETPADTVLIAPASPLPLSILTGRHEFIGLWQARRARAGYGIDPRTWIVDALGATSREFDARRALHRRVYAASEGAGGHADLIAALRALGRPVAVRFPARRSSFLAELRSRELGREIFSRDGGVVWLIDSDARRGTVAADPISRPR